ncbi:MAG: hypothetical protein EON58_15255 [Alphaproteobacteria bacterium]|nr:MAG: hypothetical protein EON58_15255 [Alphaproteobacteria bacterium]
MTDSQMKMFVWLLVTAFVACGVGLFWSPLLPWAVGFAGLVFAIYVFSVLTRARKR